LGLLHFRAGRFDEALAVYHQLLSERGHDTALRLNLGLVELRMGHHQQAAEHLALVVAAEPDNLRAHGYYGLALMRAGELVKARQVLVRAGQDELVRQVDKLLAAEQEAAFFGPAETPLDGPLSPGLEDAQPTVPVAQAPADQAPAAQAPAPPAAAPAAARPSEEAREMTTSHEPDEPQQAARSTVTEARRAASAGARVLEGEQPFIPAEPGESPRPAPAEWQVRTATQGLPQPVPSSRSPLRPIPLPQEPT